ncbi:hypothetical protein OnM2_057052 [Erysiphe neolycopersici]|uniref:Mating-type switching protein swi10 n=1 Tax=Erysiphe neolycopersici TaxID=212602 RepID=A0A420HQU4_9PEZI|nr:hypothetical protein OnM2_057052 [Erysiphe neolycopersici]
MDLLLCILGMLRKMAWNLPASESNTKLQKKRRQRKRLNKICSRDMLDAVRKSSLGLCLQSQEALGLMTAHFPPPPPEPQFRKHHSSSNSNCSSLYSIDRMQYPNVKRRPKTPIRRVGQRDDIALPCHGKARKLAADYQSVLPSRETSQEDLDQHQQYYDCYPQPLRKLRKVKSQISLRDLSKDQEESQLKRPRTDSDCDVETLVGSETTSPDSKIHDEFWRVPSTQKPSYPSIKPDRSGDSDIGLQICVDLLTNELASILFRHHPVEDNDRASELQILLMIEAYETIQKQIHEKAMEPHVTVHHVRYLEQLLDNWLDVLYDLYERSRLPQHPEHEDKDEKMRKIHDNHIEYVEADSWAPLSTSLNITRAEVRV